MKFPSNLRPGGQEAKRLKALFLSKMMLPISPDETVNVVLSPAYYWFREVVLPASNAQQAKKLAPSYFDSVIPGGAYEYMAIAQKEAFWLFAYDPALIAEAISDAGLRPSQVHAIYFAQTECARMRSPKQIDDETMLIVNEGHIGRISSRYAHADGDIDTFLNQNARSRFKVPISLYRSGWLSEKQLGRLTLIAAAVTLVYTIDYLHLRSQFNQQELKAQTLRKHYKLPETSFQLESLMRSLEGRKARQMKLRGVFRGLTLLPLRKGEVVTQLTMDEKKAQLQITLEDAKRADLLKAALEKFARVASSQVKENIYYVSIAYE